MAQEAEPRYTDVASDKANSGRKKWSLRKVAASLLVALLIFASGYAAGKGNLRPRDVDYNGKLNNTLPSQLDYSSVNRVYSLLKNNYDGNLNKNALIDGLKSGLVEATGDPYTNYFNAKEATDFDNQLSGSFTGIGAELGTRDEHIVIVSPLSGYPAEKAGLQPKDIIAAVDGQSTSGKSVDTVVKKIRGTAGTKVTLTIVRGSGSPFEVTIVRQKITIASVESHVEGNIGYLKVNQFNSDTLKLTQAAVSDFKSRGVKGVILDLRGNPGGYLDGAVELSSLWLEKGKTVVSERRGGRVDNVDRANGKNPLIGLPTVVLINNGSASASEITAGALHDNKVATLVGTITFGKGSVQQVIKLADGGER